MGEHACRVFTRATREDGAPQGEACLIYCGMSLLNACQEQVAVSQYSDMNVCKQGGVRTTSNKRRKPKSIHQYKEDVNPSAKSDLVCLPGFSSGIGSLRPESLIRLKPLESHCVSGRNRRHCVQTWTLPLSLSDCCCQQFHLQPIC